MYVDRKNDFIEMSIKMICIKKFDNRFWKITWSNLFLT